MGIFAIVVTLAAWGTRAEAQQLKKVPRIGYLSATDAVSESTRTTAFRAALRELGYVEGQNITTEYRYADGNPDRQLGLAAELVRLKIDVIVVAGGNRLIQAAKNSTKTIPIVMVGAGVDTVGQVSLRTLPVLAATSLASQPLT